VKESNVQTGDMLAMAARELEAWKMDQKKRFNDSLVQVEVQHLTLLGKEWRERERVVQEKMETLKDLEQELRQELEKVEVVRREMEEKNRSVEVEREKVEREKLDLKTEKVALVERLRQQVREKDAEIAVKTSEIEMLTKSLDLMLLEWSQRRKLLRKRPADRWITR
jgi:chromosome segregation ATPase